MVVAAAARRRLNTQFDKLTDSTDRQIYRDGQIKNLDFLELRKKTMQN